MGGLHPAALHTVRPRHAPTTGCAICLLPLHTSHDLPHSHPSTLQLQVGLLRRLLAAGAHPIRALLPSLLRRYDGCLHSSGLAEKLRSGMRVVLEHSLPPVGLGPAGSGTSVAASSSSGDSAAVEAQAAASSGPGASASGASPTVAAPAAAAEAGSEAPAGAPLLVRVRQQVFTAEEARRLLAAAVACRDEHRCCRLLGGLIVAQSRGNPWGADPEADCSLLVAAAAHDMPAVVHALLAVPPAFEGGQVGPVGWAGAVGAGARMRALATLRFDGIADCGGPKPLALSQVARSPLPSPHPALCSPPSAPTAGAATA